MFKQGEERAFVGESGRSVHTQLVRIFLTSSLDLVRPVSRSADFSAALYHGHTGKFNLCNYWTEIPDLDGGCRCQGFINDKYKNYGN